MKRIGSVKITTGCRITFLKAVAEKLNAKEGDFIDFYEKSNGEIVIKKA